MTMTPDDLTTPEPAPRSLSERVARGAAWIVSARVVVRSLGLINTLILARLLAPDDFGLVALGVTVMQLLQNISDIGVAKTVVKFRDARRDAFDTLFTISFLRGVVVAMLLVIAAQVAGAFYDDPRARGVFLGIALAPVFHGLINPRFFEFERDLDFSREFWMGAVNKVCGVIVSVTVALIFQTYWAIILGLITGAFVQTAMSYILRPYLPRFSFAAMKDLGAFTGWLTGHSFVTALNNKLDVLLLGKFLPQADVGAYFVGGSVASLPSGEIAVPIARALYPGFSELQNDAAGMREGFLRGVEALALIVLPAAFGVSFVADDLVALLLGSQWDDAVPMLRWFAPAAGVMAVFAATNAYALARGEAHLLFMRECIVFCIRMPLLIIAALVYGLDGAIMAAAAGLLLIAALNAGLYQRLSGGIFTEPFWRARRPIAGIAAMTVWFMLIRPNVAGLEEAPIAIRLAADVFVGALIYGAVVIGLWTIEGKPRGIEKTAIARVSRIISALRAP